MTKHQQHLDDPEQGDASVKRRGLLAVLAALVGGALAKSSATPAHAETDDDWVLGKLNDADQTTSLMRFGANSGEPALAVDSRGGPGGIDARGIGILGGGEQGMAAFGFGGHGMTALSNGGDGVVALSDGGKGVHGQGRNYGVVGLGDRGAGVFGTSFGLGVYVPRGPRKFRRFVGGLGRHPC